METPGVGPGWQGSVAGISGRKQLQQSVPSPKIDSSYVPDGDKQTEWRVISESEQDKTKSYMAKAVKYSDYVNISSSTIYVNMAQQATNCTSQVPPPIVPRKTVGKPTSSASLSSADKKCLLQKVPAPTPRETIKKALNKASIQSDINPSLSPSVSKQDSSFSQADYTEQNNNKDIPCSDSKRESSESGKSEDSGVNSSGQLDDGYLQLNSSTPSNTQSTSLHLNQGEIQVSFDQNNCFPDKCDSLGSDDHDWVGQGEACSTCDDDGLFVLKKAPPLPAKRKDSKLGAAEAHYPPSEESAGKETSASSLPIPPHRKNRSSLALSSASLGKSDSGAHGLQACYPAGSASRPSQDDEVPLSRQEVRTCRQCIGPVSPDDIVPPPGKPPPVPPPPLSSPSLSPPPTEPPSPPSSPPPPPPSSATQPVSQIGSQTKQSSGHNWFTNKQNHLVVEVPAPVLSEKRRIQAGLNDISDVAPLPPPYSHLPRLPCKHMPSGVQSGRQVGSYIGPDDIESVPSPSGVSLGSPVKLETTDTITTANMSHKREGAQSAYLRLVEEDDSLNENEPEKTNDASEMVEDDYYYSFLEEEPLYQLYHRRVVARDIVHQSCELNNKNEPEGTYECDDDDDASDSDDYVNMDIEQCVKEFLSKSDIHQSDYDILPNTQSSLQDIIRLGAGTRKLWAEMPQVKHSGILSSITTEEKKLQEALFEVITSEASYVKSLNLLESHFLSVPELNVDNMKYSVISKLDHHCLFSNITEVHSVCQNFLKELENLWHASCVLDPVMMANTISEFASKHFKVYVSYVSNMVFQERTFTKLRESNSEFVQVLERLEADPAVQGLSLQSFLVLPMQRITRLPLLVSTICDEIKQNQRYHDALTNCLQILQKIVQQCNESARQLNNIEKVAEISDQLQFGKLKSIPVVSQHRSIVKQGELTWIRNQTGVFGKKKSQLYFFLFNDLLLITKKKSNVYHVIDYTPRIDIHADLLTEENIKMLLPKGVPKDCQYLFIMVLMEKDLKYILASDSENERTRWVEAVTPAQQINEHEKIYEEWDCPQVQALRKYVAQQPDELSLEESDIVNVLKKVSDGWYEGQRIRDGERGWFPSNVTIEIHSAHIRAKNRRQQYRLMHGLSELND